MLPVAVQLVNLLLSVVMPSGLTRYLLSLEGFRRLRSMSLQLPVLPVDPGQSVYALSMARHTTELHSPCQLPTSDYFKQGMQSPYIGIEQPRTALQSL